MKTRQLNLRVSEEELNRWKQAAGGLPLASWVRQTLDQALQDPTSPKLTPEELNKGYQATGLDGPTAKRFPADTSQPRKRAAPNFRKL